MQRKVKLKEANDFMIEEIKNFKHGVIPQMIIEEKNEFLKNKLLFDFLHADYLERLENGGKKWQVKRNEF